MYIRKQVADGAFPTEEAVITDAVEQVMAPADPWDDEGTRQALAQAACGEVVSVDDTGDLLCRLHEEARDQSRRGVPIPDDVRYAD